MTILDHWPVFGICGYSGAGKTTLIVDLVRHLRQRGLATLVIKHDAHGLALDRPGKDTECFFAAGADVIARDPRQSVQRWHGSDLASLEQLVATSGRAYDVILVEGHKDVPFARKVWLRRHVRDRVPERVGPVAFDLHRHADRPAVVWQWMESCLALLARSAPVVAGVLIGGKSSRMGRSKHLLMHGGRTWLERIVSAARDATDKVVLLGSGHVPRAFADLPRLPDVDDCPGPLAGMRAAMRWGPHARWLFLACDTPLLTAGALGWLKAQAGPGVWAVQPRRSAAGLAEPLPGWYDSRAVPLLEAAHAPSELARHPRTVSPVIPEHLAHAWWSCNTPAEQRELRARRRTGVRRSSHPE